MESRTFRFDIRENLPGIDTSNMMTMFEEKVRLGRNSPFTKVPESEGPIAQARGSVGHECYRLPWTEEKGFGDNFCSVYHGLMGNVQARNFYEAMETLAKRFPDIDLNYGKLEMVNPNNQILSDCTVTWNNGWLNLHAPKPSRMKKRPSRMTDYVNEKAGFYKKFSGLMAPKKDMSKRE